jgi:hypothetical protein
MGQFQSDSACFDWIARGKKAGEIEAVCQAPADSGKGRQDLLMARERHWTPKKDLGDHELKLTRMYLALASAYPALRADRGCPSPAREDMTLLLRGPDGDWRWVVEMDCGNVRKKPHAERCELLAGCGAHVLFAVATANGDPRKRIDDLLAWSERIRGRVFVCALDDLLASPAGDVWVRPGSDNYWSVFPEPGPGPPPESVREQTDATST